MIRLIRERYSLKSAESLELVTRAMTEIIADPELARLLTDLAPSMSDVDKEEVALMALKVIAADGRRHFDEMEHFNLAMDALHISPHIVHRAFDRYFAETMPGI